MNKENRNNDLDKFFSTRLKSEKQGDSGWNVPDDDLLEGAFRQMDLNAKPTEGSKSKRRFFLLFFAGLVFIGTGSFAIFKTYQVDLLNNEISTLNLNLEQSQSALQNSNLSSSNLDEIQTPTKINPESSTGSTETARAIEISTSKKDNLKFEGSVQGNSAISRSQNVSTRNSGNLKSSISSPTIDRFLFNTEISNSKPNTILEKNISSQSTLPLIKNERTALSITALQQNQFSLLNADKRALPNFFIDEDLRVDQASKWGSYISLGHLYSTFLMSAPQSQDFQLYDYDKYYTGWQINSGVSYELTKNLKAIGQIGYKKTNNKSLHKRSTTFDENNVFTNTEGRSIYSTQMNIETPIGQYADEMNIDISSFNLEDGDAMDSKTHIEQSLDHLTLTGLIDYTFLRKNDFEFSINTGISLNKYLGSKQTLAISMYKGVDEMGTHEFSAEMKNNVRQLFLESQIGINVRRKFRSNAFVQAGLNYHRSLQSISTDNLPSTKIQSFNSSLVLGYQF